ncbi:MAG: flagellar basal body L-ring protein FlgH [Candidatus Scalindua rubra]|nr:flagellar basal body L-ring protein FlgH [Candidatus Scalindua rubra]TWU34000.1 Flagellar L-ring protein precursor [Candidatus Brocadiaceae bacterium S225]
MIRLRKKTILNFIIVICVLSVVCNAIHADSLWKKRATVNYNLFDDNRGKRVGDIVTVTVSETANILNTETNTTDNTSSSSGSIDNDNFMTGLRHALSSGRNARIQDSRAANTFSTEYTGAFSGGGSNDVDKSVSVTITAMVVEVLDNGNLALEGKRDIAVNKEKYTLTLTGIARPIDITTANTVASSKMSNVLFGLTGKGWLTRAGSKGWFNRIKDVIWPF